MKQQDISTKKQKLLKMENIITKRNNLLDELNSRMEMTGDRTNELENRSIEFTQSGQEREID